ncbi:MAG: phospholipase D family protein [Nitrososphaerota archaeon]
MRPQVLVLVALLAAAVAGGFGAGAYIRPVTYTETSTIHTMLSSSITSTVTVPTTLTTSTTTTAYNTRTTTTSRFLTTSVTSTVRTTTTNTATIYITSTLKQVQFYCFSKPQDCASLIIAKIDSASQYVHVMVYSFTSDQLADALIRAKNRGVDVKVVIESQQANVAGSEYQRLTAAGIDVRLDGNPQLMHHKVAVIDGVIVLTGSYNWSAAAENDNDENLIIIEDPSVAAAYEAEFQRVWGQGRTAITTTTTTRQTTTTTSQQNCDPSYPDVCIPPPPPDLDCSDIPYRNFRVLPPDPHNFDRDRDGIGCET